MPQVEASTDRPASTSVATSNAVNRQTVLNWSLNSAAIAVGGCIALGLALFSLSRHNSLYGLTEYDDGVYFGSAMRLVTGHMPYKDFVLVQPPGITLLMSPIALIGRVVGSRDGLALARILTAFVAGANAMLIAYLLRYRGRAAMAIGGMAFGIFPPAFIAYRNVELEPYLVLFCLIGVALLFKGGEFASRRRIFLGGIAFGLAGTMKSFAIIPVVVLLVLLLIRRRRDVGAFILAVAAGFVIPCLPFFLAAPHGFVRDVVLAQLGRQTLARATLQTRLAGLTGLGDAVNSLRHFGPLDGLPIRIALIIAAIVVLGAIAPSMIRRVPSLDWFAIVSMIGSVLAIIAAPSFYNHYAYFSQAFVSLTIGIVAWRVVSIVRRIGARRSSAVRRVSLRALACLMGACIAAGSGLLIASESSYAASVMDAFGDPGPAIAAVIPKGACTISDAASLLVSANRLVSSDPECPTIIDGTGTWIATDPNHPPIKCGPPTTRVCGPPEPALTAEWKSWLEKANYAIFSGVHSFRIPWTPALTSWFQTHYERVPNSPLPVFERIHNAPTTSSSSTTS